MLPSQPRGYGVHGSIKKEEADSKILMLQVVSHKHGACHGMTAYVFLQPGTYILQMRIDPHHCHHIVDEAGRMDREYTWNINVLPSVVEPLSAFIITPDTAKTKYMQVTSNIALCLAFANCNGL